MKLTDYDKYIISIINSNDIEKICENFSGFILNIYLFKKENINLFNKSKYFKYIIGHYCYFGKNNIKAKKLMKYNNPFIFLFHYLGIIYYYQFKKYNKAKYYLNKKKYNKEYERHSFYHLSKMYYCLKKTYKSLYFSLKDLNCSQKYNNKNFIFFILNIK